MISRSSAAGSFPNRTLNCFMMPGSRRSLFPAQPSTASSTGLKQMSNRETNMMEKVKKIKSGDVRTASRLIRQSRRWKRTRPRHHQAPLPADGTFACHRDHRLAGRGEKHAGRRPDRLLPEKGEDRRRAGRRPDQPLHGRRHPRRPDPDAAPRGRPGRFCPESCHTRAPWAAWPRPWAMPSMSWMSWAKTSSSWKP